MFALLVAPILSIVTSLFGGVTSGVLSVLEMLAGSLGARFYVGLTVGLCITNNAIRDIAIDLGKAVIGAVL